MTFSRDPRPPLERLHDWFGSPLGAEVAQLEAASVERLLADTFGYYLVQLGSIEAFRDALAATRIRQRILVPFGHPLCSPGSRVLAEAAQLPFASDSVDAVLLPHVLDFAEEPRAVLSEVERILIPEGRVLITGFNALSSWGVRRFLTGSATSRMPWCGRFHSPAQVELWLGTLGLAVEVREYALFGPPLARSCRPWASSVEAVGRRVWPALGGLYVIRAVKRVAAPTPLKLAWWRRRAVLAGRAVEPSARRSNHV